MAYLSPYQNTQICSCDLFGNLFRPATYFSATLRYTYAQPIKARRLRISTTVAWHKPHSYLSRRFRKRFLLSLSTSLSDSSAELLTYLDAELAPWRSPLSRALHRNRAQAFCRFLQLATVRADGTPANRTVVFRGFLEGSNVLMFICDRRSEKTSQAQQNPHAEACWYFTKTREQFRLSGQLAVVTADTVEPTLAQARQQLWQRISDNARLQFAWPHPKSPREEDADFSPPAPDSQAPLSTFCLLLLHPHSVDQLSLRGEPQDRTIYRRGDEADEKWTVSDVNP